MSTAGMLRKFNVPSSKPASPGARMCVRPLNRSEFTVPPANHGRRNFASAGSNQQATHPCGISEHFIEGDAHEIRPYGAKVETIGRYKCRGVEKHIPAFVLSLA